MLEVLTDSEEVSRQVVVEKEVLDFTLDRSGGDAVSLQAGAVADLGVERFGRLPKFRLFSTSENVERHLIVATHTAYTRAYHL